MDPGADEGAAGRPIAAVRRPLAVTGTVPLKVAGRWAGRDGFASGGRVADECGVDELFEPDDESASHDEVMGHPHI